MRPSSGFTLVEILLTLGLVISLVGLSAALGSQAVRHTEFDRVRESIRSELTAARTDSIGGTLDSSWGVAFFPHAITRYRGTNYATRSTAEDRTLTFENAVLLSGAAEVTFTRPFGIPSAPATIVASDGLRTASTTVNAIGTIDVL